MINEEIISKMRTAAKKASERAYQPYSKFSVGAAVLTNEGAIYTGCNVENASYGLTICAERNAVFHMVMAGHQKIAAVLVYTPTPEPTAPCGACRQVINEFGSDAEVICACEGESIIKMKLSEMLPRSFGPHNLER